MESNTFQSDQNKPKRQWSSYAILALIAIILVVFLYNRSKTDSVPEQVQATASTANSELERAKDNALSNPGFDTYVNLGLLYYRNEEYQNCINITIKALEFSAPPEKQALAYNNIGSAYNVLSMPDSAIKACEKALSLKPDMELAKNNLKAAKSAIKNK